MYEELKVEGFFVNYERVSVTDEKFLKELDFDILVGLMFCLLNLCILIWDLWYL